MLWTMAVIPGPEGMVSPGAFGYLGASSSLVGGRLLLPGKGPGPLVLVPDSGPNISLALEEESRNVHRRALF